jgi:Rap1a immunity proteins
MSSKHLMFLIPVVLLLVPQSASAETAEEMLTGCRIVANAAVSDQKVDLPNDREAVKCWGAFTVVQELTRWVTPSGREFDVCNSATTTRTQLIAVFVAYVDRNPQRRNSNFVEVVFEALKEAFPCKADASEKNH